MLEKTPTLVQQRFHLFPPAFFFGGGEGDAQLVIMSIADESTTAATIIVECQVQPHQSQSTKQVF